MSAIILTMSANNLRNTTIDSEVENIHYVISSPNRTLKTTFVTTIKRLDRTSGEYVHVADWERSYFKSDRFRMLNPTTSDFASVNEFLKRTWGLPCSSAML